MAGQITDNHKKSFPRLREASFDDYPQVSALQIANGLEAKKREQWEHLWLTNPAYRHTETRLPIGWVLENDGRKIVGYLGNIPLLYEFRGERLLTAAAHAWVVDASYRSYSLWLLHQYFSQNAIDLFLNATVGPAAAESFAVFNSQRVPVGEWDRSVFWITHYPGFAASWLALKASPFVKPLSYLLSVGFAVKEAIAHPRVPKMSLESEVGMCGELDDRFDEFWEILRRSNSHVLLAVRNREALEWHLGHALRQNKAWIVTASGNSGMEAYAVFLRYDKPKVGLKRLRLVDFQSLEGSENLLEPILSWSLERCRADGIGMLETIGFGTEKSRVVRGRAPYSRKLPAWLYFYRTRDPGLAEALSNPRAWDPSQFDGDASL